MSGEEEAVGRTRELAQVLAQSSRMNPGRATERSPAWVLGRPRWSSPRTSAKERRMRTSARSRSRSFTDRAVASTTRSPQGTAGVD
jgi:hypothetical protein